ncbi:hypothetical protein L596_012165 [Steinernema carpocapsae]|uniref:Uncharacterized protein n=1 Tax=Steinernema carpocapsae TaxID=34508 RepID=A0A4U5NWA9_STECR|nr:hypothetical protein L596_012165 [Steinernema carpocapsae]
MQNNIFGHYWEMRPIEFLASIVAKSVARISFEAILALFVILMCSYIIGISFVTIRNASRNKLEVVSPQPDTWTFYAYTILDCVTFTATNCLYVILCCLIILLTYIHVAFPLVSYQMTCNQKKNFFIAANVVTAISVLLEMMRRLHLPDLGVKFVFVLTVIRPDKAIQVSQQLRQPARSHPMMAPHFIFMFVTIGTKLAHSYAKIEKAGEDLISHVDWIHHIAEIGRKLILPRNMTMMFFSLIAMRTYRTTTLSLLKKLKTKIMSRKPMEQPAPVNSHEAIWNVLQSQETAL